MTLVEINWSPSDRQLRQFGAISMVALPLIAWLWGAGLPAILIVAGVGAIIAAAGFVVPKILKPIFLTLTVVATPIGIAIGEVAVLLIFFCVFLPIGIWFRLTKRDALQMKLDRNARTYWQPKRQPKDAASYFRQF